jgi:hypothetical protein
MTRSPCPPGVATPAASTAPPNQPCRTPSSAGAYLLIVSGGYGVVLADEPIGYYNREYQPGDWPDSIVRRALAAYADRWALSSVVAIAGHSTQYAKAIRRVRSPGAVAGAVLVSPAHQGAGRGLSCPALPATRSGPHGRAAYQSVGGAAAVRPSWWSNCDDVRDSAARSAAFL